MFGVIEFHANGEGKAETLSRVIHQIGPCCYPAMVSALRALRD